MEGNSGLSLHLLAMLNREQITWEVAVVEVV